MEKKVGEVYKCIHIWIKQKSDKYDCVVGKDIINRVLGELLHIPKHHRNRVIKELEDFGFIVQINRGRAGIKYKVLG